MKRDNSVYEITPPSLLLVGSGIGVHLIGNPADMDEIQTIIERYNYDSELYFFKNPVGINSDTIAWASSATRECDLVIADLDTVNNYELSLALLAAGTDKPVLFLSRKPADKELSKLLSGFNLKVIPSLELLSRVVENIFSSDDD